MTYVLETHGVGMRYRSVWALKECDLALPAGRVIALVGPNGAGKTTLLRLVAGLLEPTEGTISVLGSPAVVDTPEGMARVGFVAQDHPLYKRFRVADLLRMGRSMNLRWDQDLAEKRLAALGIPLERRAGALSGGQQAQVSLTLALARRPHLMILDEPVAGLDPLARREFMQALMGAVAEGGQTVVLSSHVVGELERICDYLVLLVGGRVRVAGDIDDLLAGHRTLVGPRSDKVDGDGVVLATHGDRHTNLVVRTGAAPLLPGWQAHSLNLEDLVLAYLQGAHVKGAQR